MLEMFRLIRLEEEKLHVLIEIHLEEVLYKYGSWLSLAIRKEINCKEEKGLRLVSCFNLVYKFKKRR